MLGSLFRNAAISAAAFFAVTVVGLLLVPVLISSYGLAGFGQITLARLFLPAAAFAVFDFGFGEIATQAVATARVDRDWKRCARMLTLSIGTAAATGAATAVGLVTCARFIPGWMSVTAANRSGLSAVLVVTGWLLPVFFVSLVFEGIVKGFENYAAQRAIEVIAALIYAALALTAVWQGWGVDAACYALLVSLMLRAAMAGAIANRALRPSGVRFCGWQPDDRSAFVSRTRAMAANKVLGTSQTQLAPMLIGLLLGPASVGAFDALSRLPRFAKSVLGMLNATVLPVAARLESAADTENMQRLGQTGMLIIALISVPPLGAAMAFSEPLLRVWLGAVLARDWYWQAVMFLIPALAVLVSFGGTVLMVRQHAIVSMNRLVALQIFIQFAVSIVTMKLLAERAFMLGQVVAVVLTFFLQMRLINTQMGISAKASGQFARIFCLAGLLVLPAMILATRINGVLVLILCMLMWILLCWLLCFRFALDSAQRVRLIAIVDQRLNGKVLGC